MSDILSQDVPQFRAPSGKTHVTLCNKVGSGNSWKGFEEDLRAHGALTKNTMLYSAFYLFMYLFGGMHSHKLNRLLTLCLSDSLRGVRIHLCCLGIFYAFIVCPKRSFIYFLYILYNH